MAKLNIKKGDNVMIITGKEKGKKGKVLAVKEGKVLVEGANIVTRARKPRSAQDKGGLIKKEAAIDASNVMLVCPSCGKPSKVGIKVVDGKKVRFCKKCKKEFIKVAEKKASEKTTKTADEKKSEEKK